MRINPVSDLHIDFSNWKPRLDPDSFDAFVIAGDTGNKKIGVNSIQWAIKKYGKPVILVLGNHEYYDGVFQEVNRYWKDLEKRPEMKGLLHVLINESVEIQGQRFVGTTLWVDIPPQMEVAIKQEMNDFNWIKYQDDKGMARKLDVPTVNQWHREAKQFLDRELREEDYLITHHAVCSLSCADHFRGDPASCGWIADISEVILDRKPKIVQHGHVHDSFDYMLGDDSRVICNPKGYSGMDVNKKFDPSLIINTKEIR